MRGSIGESSLSWCKCAQLFSDRGKQFSTFEQLGEPVDA